MNNPSDLQRTGEWKSTDILFCIAAADDFSRLWFGSSDASVYELDLSAEKPVRTELQGAGHSSYVTGMARTGQTLVTGSYDKRLIWWDLDSRQQIRSVDAHDRWIRRVIATPDGSRLISIADDMRCRVWDAVTGERIADFSDHAETTPHHYPSMLYAVAVSADGTKIATGDRVGHVAIWDAQTFEKLTQLEAPVMYTWDPKQRRHSIGGIRSVAFSPDGQRLAVGGIGKIGNIDHLGGPSRLELFDLASGDRLHEIEDNKKQGLIEQIAWSADGACVLAIGGGHNGIIWIYDADSGKQLHVADYGGHMHAMVHDQEFANIAIAAHEHVSRWTMSPQT